MSLSDNKNHTSNAKKETDQVHEPQPAYHKTKHTLEDYFALPDDQRVELIDGKFYVMESPSWRHQAISMELCARFHSYVTKNAGNCRVFFAPLNVQLDCDEYTMLQPDIFILCGHEKLKNNRVVGAPDLIVEILSPSTQYIDLFLKLKKYRDAGVREYWIVDIKNEQITVYLFGEKETVTTYDAKDSIPVDIYDGNLSICAEEIFSKIR